MKQQIITFIFLLFVSFSFAQKNTASLTTIEFEETSFDFGQIDAGEKVSHVYKFKNTGDNPLIISNTTTGCGCLAPKWPKAPIQPGASSEIEIVFDSKGKNGAQHKRITITANIDYNQTFLTLHGKVKGEERPIVEAPKMVSPSPAFGSQKEIPNDEFTTTIEFEKTIFDFGTINAGEKVNHVYTFKNTGNNPLVIKNAKGSCGCTVPEWSKEPILPGETGIIEVEYNSKGKKGKETKRVTITANTTPAQTYLTITGEVIPKTDLPKFTYVPPTIANEGTPKTTWKKPDHKDCVAIFPNPTAEVLKLELKEYQGKSININIFDGSGKVMTNKVINEITDELIEFNVRNYVAGNYYVNMVIDKDIIVTKCFIVTKN